MNIADFLITKNFIKMNKRERIKLIIENWFIEKTSINITEDVLNNIADKISQNGHECNNVIEGEHISTNEMTIEEENKKLREEIERLKKKLNDKV